MSVKEYFDAILAMPDEEFDAYVESLGLSEKIISEDMEITEVTVSTTIPEYEFKMDFEMDTIDPPSYYITQKAA